MFVITTWLYYTRLNEPVFDDIIRSLVIPYYENAIRRATGVPLKVVPPVALLSLWLGLATPPILQHTWDAAVQSLLPGP